MYNTQLSNDKQASTSFNFEEFKKQSKELSEFMEGRLQENEMKELLNSNQILTKELPVLPSGKTTPTSSTTPVATPRARPRDFPGAFTAEAMGENLDKRSGLHEVTSPILKTFNLRDSLFGTTEDSSSTKGGG